MTPTSPQQITNLSDDRKAIVKIRTLTGSTGRFPNKGQHQVGRLLQKEISGRLSANDQSDEDEEVKYDRLLEEWTQEWHRRHHDSESLGTLMIEESSSEDEQPEEFDNPENPPWSSFPTDLQAEEFYREKLRECYISHEIIADLTKEEQREEFEEHCKTTEYRELMEELRQKSYAK